VNVLKSLGWTQLTSDKCFFIKGNEMIILHVDDLLFACESDANAKQLFDELNKVLKLEDTGDVEFFLKIRIERDEKGFVLSQTTFIEDVYKEYQMEYSKPVLLSTATLKATSGLVLPAK
jgi:hypothetical protein